MQWARWLIAQTYTKLPGAYDLAAQAATAGLYRRWTFAAEQFLPEGPVLEVGCGTGHLLARLAARGMDVTGVDLSPHMARLAERRLRRRGLPGRVICADARRLPLPPAGVAAIINAFPTSYVLDPATWAEYARVLRPGGRWIVVEGPCNRPFRWRLLGWYLVLTAEGYWRARRARREVVVPPDLFPQQCRHHVPVGPTRVMVAVLEKAR